MGKNCRIGSNVIIGRAVKLGNNVSIGKDVFFENIEIGDYTSVEGRVICTGYGNGKIKIGRNSYIGIYNVLDWSDNITIGDFVHIAGPSTGLWTHTSAPMCLNSIPLDEKSKKYRPTAPIVIESNVYIGGNCTIYPGIKIGHHSIVAPNSAVTKDVPPYTMVGGVPAKIIKNLPKSDTKC
jgi:acetyltransferase-like isoleucine patch superfamily enzyme